MQCSRKVSAVVLLLRVDVLQHLDQSKLHKRKRENKTSFESRDSATFPGGETRAGRQQEEVKGPALVLLRGDKVESGC